MISYYEFTPSAPRHMHLPVHIIITITSSYIILLLQMVFHFRLDRRISKVGHFHHKAKDLIILRPFTHYYIPSYHIIHHPLATLLRSYLPLVILLLEEE